MAAALSAPAFASFSSSSQTYRRGSPAISASSSMSCSSTVSSGKSHVEGVVLSASGQQDRSVNPSTTGQFYGLLQKCIQDNDMIRGEEVYFKIVESGLKTDSFLGCHLIRMFTSFGDLWRANQVFEELREPSVYAWGAIILAHANLGCSERAIELYFQMRTSALEPDGHVVVAAVQACTSLGSLVFGTLVHDDIVEAGVDSCGYVGNTLIDMYAKCGRLQDACAVFDKLTERDVVSWNVIIGAFGQHGDVEEAIRSLKLMSGEGFQPNVVSCVGCLSVCALNSAMEQGKELHTYLTKHALDADMRVVLALIEMYVAWGYLDDARSVLENGKTDTKTFEFMVSTYVLHKHDLDALELLQLMQKKGIPCSVQTLISSLRACASVEDLDRGWGIHSSIVENGYEHEKFVGNTLIDLYGKCRSADDAKVHFERLQHRDIVSWSALISGLAADEKFEDALSAFRQMQENGLKPNEITFTCVLKACSGVASSDNGVEHGRWIHSLIIDEGFEQNIILGGCLVDMYVKCGNLEDACVLVGKLPEQDVVIWSALIAGFAQHGYGQEALKCFKQMQSTETEPTTYTIVAVLRSCSLVSALEQARQIHKYSVCRGLESESILGGALVDTYGRCGSLNDACAVFDSLHSPDIVSWGTMISGFAQNNDYESAVQCYHNMEEHGHVPNAVIFTCLLTACCHANCLKEGCHHFKSIREHYGLLPTLEHYYSMVELLGHGGHFDEAEDLMESIPFQSTIVGWTSLLAASRHHGNLKLGRRCFQHAVRINPGYSSEYRLMRSLYRGAGLLDDAAKVEELRISANAWKKPAKAFIEIDNHVHCFIVGDKTHRRSGDIYAKLESLSDMVKNEGYTPSITLMPELGSVSKNGDASMVHSEKLAIAFGLISTPEGTTIRLSKNLRVCADCHAAAKAISKVEMRDIIIADAYQIHHFHDGSCSCVNFW